jgi:hypothetical protein
MKALLTLLTIISAQVVLAQTQPLFLIVEKGRVGYINAKGETVISPTYWNGNDFSEGLAAVRQNGYYGFINGKGDFVIKPEYELATCFLNGLAAVYKNGKVIFIDKEGKRAIPEVYKSMSLIDSSNRKAIVRTYKRRQGIIDLVTKQLLVDTVFGLITPYECGVAIVQEYSADDGSYDRSQVGVIDTSGKFIVPFGKYKEIHPFRQNYAVVKIREHRKRDNGTDGVIDAKGNLLFKRPYKNGYCLEENYNEGVAAVNLYRKSKDKSASGLDYQGFIDLHGNVVLNDTNYMTAGAFADGRAFMKISDDQFVLIDRNFKQVGKDSYEEILTNTFSNGLAIVKMPEGYAIIDTAGNFRSRYRYYDIHYVGIVDGYFFFGAEKGEDKTLYGIADVDGNVICKPLMVSFDKNGFENGLLRASIDGGMAYINKSGRIVWRQFKDTSTALKYLNIDYMNRGYFYAYESRGEPGTGHSGGWATSSNTPQKITEQLFPGNQLAITIDTTRIDTFATAYYGYALFVSNTSADTVRFNAQDSRLYIKLQVQYGGSEWRDIEYLPSSWCGNSYHTLDLEPGAYWHFTIPNYQGETKAKIRAELKYINKQDPKKDKIIYSNEINGSVNPAQFWWKPRYTPDGIMDPYFE